MRIATGTLLTGLVLLASAAVGIESAFFLAVGVTALVVGALALAVSMEARDHPRPSTVRQTWARDARM